MRLNNLIILFVLILIGYPSGFPENEFVSPVGPAQ